MNFDIRDLYFDHVIKYCNRQLKKDWQDGILLLEDLSLLKDIYQTGPILFTFESVENEPGVADFTYYMPINDAVLIEDDPYYEYLPNLYIQDALALRQADQTVDFQAAYEKLVNYANDQNIPIGETFYCVLLEAYGEYIIDLYVPVERRGEFLI